MTLLGVSIVLIIVNCAVIAGAVTHLIDIKITSTRRNKFKG